MNQFNIYKLLGVILVISVSFLYIQQARAAVIIEFIQDNPWIGIVLMVLAVVLIAFVAGAIVAQGFLALGGGIVTVGGVVTSSLAAIAGAWVGTAVIIATMVGAGLWAADCLFDGSAIDPSIICTGTSESGLEGGGGTAGQANLEVDVRVNGVDGPLTFRAPAAFEIQWAIAGADPSTSCNATGAWSGVINNATGKTTLSDVVRGDYNYGIGCIKAGNEVSDNVEVIVNNLPVCTFSSSPKEIISPAASTLSWECQYADSCQISNGTSTPVSNISGTLEVRPSETTTYILTCDNADGSVNLTTEVKVTAPRIREVPPGGE